MATRYAGLGGGQRRSRRQNPNGKDFDRKRPISRRVRVITGNSHFIVARNKPTFRSPEFYDDARYAPPRGGSNIRLVWRTVRLSHPGVRAHSFGIDCGHVHPDVGVGRGGGQDRVDRPYILGKFGRGEDGFIASSDAFRQHYAKLIFGLGCGGGWRGWLNRSWRRSTGRGRGACHSRFRAWGGCGTQSFPQSARDHY